MQDCCDERSPIGEEQFPNVPRSSMEGILKDGDYAVVHLGRDRPGGLARVERDVRPKHIVLRRVPEHRCRRRHLVESEVDWI